MATAADPASLKSKTRFPKLLGGGQYKHSDYLRWRRKITLGEADQYSISQVIRQVTDILKDLIKASARAEPQKTFSLLRSFSYWVHETIRHYDLAHDLRRSREPSRYSNVLRLIPMIARRGTKEGILFALTREAVTLKPAHFYSPPQKKKTRRKL